MVSLHLDTPLINGLLRRIAPEYRLEYKGGCLLGRAKLPLGAVSLVVVPSCSSSHLVLTLPFKEIKGENTPAFLVSKLVGAFWGTISKQVESTLLPKLRKAGLPPDAVTLQRAQTPHGDVGKVLISLDAANGWLASQHPRLQLTVAGIDFAADGIDVRSHLARIAKL